MRIRFLENTSAVVGARIGFERDVPDPLGRHLCRIGHAVEVAAGAPLGTSEIETATKAAPETGAKRPRRKRGVQPPGGLI